MEFKYNGKKADEIEDDDPIELPSDTLAILNEFLQNKSMQESTGTSHSNFEEDWVKYLYWNIKRFISYSYK